MSQKILPLALTLLLALTACESTQSSNMTMKLNGFPLNNYQSGVNSGNMPAFCTTNPNACIGLGILGAGLLGFAWYNNHDDDENIPNPCARPPHGAAAAC